MNKAQQDALLPWVENGTIILIGATTENPYFEVNKALVSRSRIFQLKPLSDSGSVCALPGRRWPIAERGYGKLNVEHRARGARPPGGRGERRCPRGAERPGTGGGNHTTAITTARFTSDLAVAEESSSSGPCSTTRKAMSTTTPSARSSRACAAPTPMLRSTGWRAWCMPARTRASSSAAC